MTNPINSAHGGPARTISNRFRDVQAVLVCNRRRAAQMVNLPGAFQKELLTKGMHRRLAD